MIFIAVFCFVCVASAVNITASEFGPLMQVLRAIGALPRGKKKKKRKKKSD